MSAPRRLPRPLAALLIPLLSVAASAQALPDNIDISGAANGIVPLPPTVHPVFTNTFDRYTKIVAPNGVPIHFLLQGQVTDEMGVRAREVMRFFLTDAPGTKYGASKTAVANRMANVNATLTYFNTEQAAFQALSGPLGGAQLFIQDLYAEESVVEGTSSYVTNSVRDATLEEVFHLVHGAGILPILPAFHDEITDATNAAIAANIYNPPPAWQLPPQDRPFEYIISVIDVHYGFWAHDPDGDGTSFGGEYAFNTQAAMEAGDPRGVETMLKFLPDHFAAHLDMSASLPALAFDMTLDAGWEYTLKSQYLQHLRLSGSNASSLLGNARDNELAGNAGDNLLDGRAGDDTALFQGALSEYGIQCAPPGLVVADTLPGRDGVDTLLSIERLRFSDQEVPLSQLCPVASAVIRNGTGANPACLASLNPPALGCTWTAQIDVSSHPGTVSTVLAGYLGFVSGQPSPFGELLIDLTSPPAFSTVAAPVGSAATHAIPVPSSAGLLGLPVYTQGLLVSSSLDLCNAVDLVLGLADCP